MNFSQVVLKKMKDLKMTRTELAKKTSISISYICELLNNNRRWNEEYMQKVCHALNLEIKFTERAS